MKILITGVSGFIGSSIAIELSKKFDVYGISNQKSTNKNESYLDLLDLDSCCKYFDKNNFDIIIHLASIMASKKTTNDFSLIDNNLLMTKNLIHSLRNKKKGYLINFSSSAVYPNITGKFHEESKIDSSKNSDCLYGLSKFNNEILFNYFLKNHKILNLRLGYVYGENMNQSRIHKVFENEIKKKNKITIWGNGDRMFPQLSIEYLSKILIEIIDNQLEGTYNLAEENISLMNLAKKYIKLYGNKKSQILFNNQYNNNSKFEMDSDKLNIKLNKK